MKCPVCPDASLVMTDRQGVEIDYCPTCRGVWLDRGELDKIIERSAVSESSSRSRRDDDDDDVDDDVDDDEFDGDLGEDDEELPPDEK